MAKSSLPSDTETTAIMRMLRNKTKSETQEFLSELSEAIRIVLDSLEGSQKVFYLITPDMAKSQITIRFGSTIGLSELPQPIRDQVLKESNEQIAKEHGEIEMVLEGKVEKPTKTLEERLKQIEDEHPEPQQEPHPPQEKKEDGEKNA